jgi:hypothetical protein
LGTGFFVVSEDLLEKFLLEKITPIELGVQGKLYRASAFLIDDTYLPCVVFANRSRRIEQAIKRFKETSESEEQYKWAVDAFVTGPSVPIYDVARVELSPFAWPDELLGQIHGETSMGWTAFTAKMKDGKIFSFGTSFRTEFFDLPHGYSYDDIIEIHPGRTDNGRLYREKPYFYCYSDWLPY